MRVLVVAGPQVFECYDPAPLPTYSKYAAASDDMAVNRDKPDRWHDDITRSVDLYNAWFMEFAPGTFRATRIHTTQEVEATLKATRNLADVSPAILKANPGVLPALRMCTCPPIARDRLIGLAGVSDSIVHRMEKERKLPHKLKAGALDQQLKKIGDIIEKMADPDIFVWKNRKQPATEAEIHRAATIVADRLCGAWADPIIRNAQEARQLKVLGEWLATRGYRQIPPGTGLKFNVMEPGTYACRLNVPVRLGQDGSVNIAVDAVIQPKRSKRGSFPLLVEAKSAGDFTNVNKRRKEEAKKVIQLRNTYGEKLHFVLLLCGYFDSGYLGYEAADGIDWVWEHRIEDFALFGL